MCPAETGPGSARHLQPCSGDVRDDVAHLQVRQADVAALHRQVPSNAGVSSFRDFHPRTIA